ncbi:hypothetical protein J2Z21_001955 [Streptomyces griseochromogenes]|uniref:Uncharacterized protein n=1 Tax=Streptomyces griseochromogenes TaxID=68214 RepID=A0ABS4LNS2_9ACTN|nr:hypothetical protein [Streptomyces griseochromogenes]
MDVIPVPGTSSPALGGDFGALELALTEDRFRRTGDGVGV